MIIIPVSKYRERMTDALCELVAIPSVKGDPAPNMPYGKGCFKALNYIMDLADIMGLDAQNLGGHMCCVSYGRGSETLAILTHLDVVPAGDGWVTDPFKPVIKDGKIFGRGTIDDKGGAIASLFALYALKENDINVNKRIKLFFGCDEESGWGDIDYYKAHYPDPEYMITPDAGFPMINREKGLLHIDLSLEKGEKNGIVVRLDSGERPNIVPNKASCVVRANIEDVRALLDDSCPAHFALSEVAEGTKIDVEGKASHGSHPEGGINALAYLIELLIKLPLKDSAGDTLVSALHALISTGYDGQLLGIAQSDELVGALTVNLGAMHSDEDAANAKLDIRTPINTDLDALFGDISEKFEKLGIGASVAHMQPSHYVPEDSFIVTALKRAYKAVFNEECECLPCAGATYARAFENGVAFGPCDINADRGEHGPNEFIYIDELCRLADALATAMTAIAAE